MVKNPPSNAGDMGSIPGRGTKIPHATGQLSSCTLEPACRNEDPMCHKQDPMQGFPGGAVVKNPPANAGDKGSSPGPGRSHMPQSN